MHREVNVLDWINARIHDPMLWWEIYRRLLAYEPFVPQLDVSRETSEFLQGYATHNLKMSKSQYGESNYVIS